MPDNKHIRDAIYTVHHAELGNQLAGVVLCGSVNSGLTVTSDIDFVVVLDEMTGKNMQAAIASRIEVSKLVGYSISNTIIDLSEVEGFTSHPTSIDGKAAQGLIEAANQPSRIMGLPHTPILLPSPQLIRSFSRQNFGALDQFIRKTVARAESAGLSPLERRKIANVGLIALKMRLQYDEPHQFSEPGSCDPFDIAYDNESTGTFLSFARAVKAHPESYSGDELLAGVSDFLLQTRRHFMTTDNVAPDVSLLS